MVVLDGIFDCLLKNKTVIVLLIIIIIIIIIKLSSSSSPPAILLILKMSLQTWTVGLYQGLNMVM